MKAQDIKIKENRMDNWLNNPYHFKELKFFNA